MKSSPKGCLLVLEDSDEDFDTLMVAVRQANLPNEILRASTGDECIKLLRQKTETDPTSLPLLALLDLNTPQGDGRYALQTLRHDERFKSLPIVVLSTSDNPSDLEFCYREGANAYHKKSVSFPAHVQTVRQIFDYWLSGVILPFSH